jgi:hypothetical protein
VRGFLEVVSLTVVACCGLCSVRKTFKGVVSKGEARKQLKDKFKWKQTYTHGPVCPKCFKKHHTKAQAEYREKR